MAFPVAIKADINLSDLGADYPTIFSAHARDFLNAQATDNDLCDLCHYYRTIYSAHIRVNPIAHIN
jgi:hypothetical protein